MENRRKKQVVLSFDPSLTAFGWVVISYGGKYVEGGCIVTKPSGKKLRIRKGDDRCRRIHELNSRLLQLFEKYNVRCIVSEQPHGSQSAVTAVMIGITLGIIQTLSDALKVPIEWYNEGECKKYVIGSRSASKGMMIEAVSKLYPDVKFTGKKYIDEAVADAVAVYHTARNESPLIQMLHG